MKRQFFHIIFICGLLLMAVSASAQKIHGVVTDSLTNEPVPFLSVYYEGKGVGCITDLEGNYSIDVHPGWNTLTFQSVG
jgi:hypothetical protein